jgi:hypothetical protein
MVIKYYNSILNNEFYKGSFGARVRQCPYETSFLCSFLECEPFLNQKIKFSNSAEFYINW